MSVPPPAGIGFDFDHTLGIDNGLERRALLQLAVDLGHPVAPEYGAAGRRLDALLAAFRAGDVDLAGMIAQFARELNVPHVDPDAWRERCYALVDELVRPIPDAPEVIAALRRRGIPLAILTNGWSPLQQMKIARALGDKAFETVLVSDQLGAAKPERAAFDALVAAFGAPPGDVWYVGDSPRADVAGALAAGLRAVWFDWEGQTYPADLPPPTRHIRTLRELQTLTQNTLAP